VGVLDNDLRVACLGALKLSREACRAFALTRSWEVSARQFIAHVNMAALARSPQQQAAFAVQAAANG